MVVEEVSEYFNNASKFMILTAHIQPFIHGIQQLEWELLNEADFVKNIKSIKNAQFSSPHPIVSNILHYRHRTWLSEA